MTYNQIIDLIFGYCVELLIIGAQSLGMTYEELNVWFFIVIEPIIFIVVLSYAWRLRNQNGALRKHIEPTNRSTDPSHSRCTGYLVSPRTP